MSYSVGVQNIFELLDDENDDQPNVKTPKTKLDDDKVVAKPATKSTQPVVGDRAPVKGAHRDQNRREGGNQRSPKPRGDRPPRPEGDRAPREGGDRPRAPRNDGDRPPRRPRPEFAAGGSSQNQNLPEGGDRRPRGSRPQGKVGEERDKERWQKETRENRSAPGDGSGKRVYDRRSGTGRGPKENKKSGAGGANWGNEKDPNVELDAEQEVKEDAKAEQTEEGAPAASGEVAAEAAAVEEKPKVEEPEGVSLEEFKRQREAKLAALPTLPPPRKAGEGVTDKEKDAWAQVSITPEASSAPVVKETRGTAKKETVSLDKLFHVKSKEERDRAERRDRPDRSDRDRPDRRDRGDRPEREDRKPRTERTDKRPADRKPRDAPAKPQTSKPKADIVNNDQEFPTLATKA